MKTLMCGGHLLVEDVPGVGKTMLARSLARSSGCSFSRIQFTPDLLPTDVTGVSIYNQKSGDFQFRPGPLLTQIVLADALARRFRSLRDVDLLAQAYGRSRFGRRDALESEERQRLARAWAKLRGTLAWQAVRRLWRRR